MFGFIPASEQAIRERAKNAALAEATNKNAANVDYIAMMCDIELDSDTDTTITDEIAPGDHFYANDTEYVFKGASDNGDIIAEEADDSSKEGGDNE